MIRLSFSNTRRIDITDCEWKDLQTAIKAGSESYGCFDGAQERDRSALVDEFEKLIAWGCGHVLTPAEKSRRDELRLVLGQSREATQ